ncbi:MAG TPA: hypothetical protein GX391_06010 [Firmicutes bacterium]|jgi:hypothetical protein|nr:hypothetical protein [Bacillota bacterium]HOQ23761.1 GT-D fold domain-containing glycosyltransferase [Bacillota bacterium]HPT66905.1 GT-D fold domain-containing glycosyltransferase [Bacillota bacterium]
MSFSSVPDSALLSEIEVLKRIKHALVAKRPFSLVRIGDGENIVMGQYTLLPEDKFMNTYWVRQNFGRMAKGVTLPNTKLRDQLVWGVRNADIVGICKKYGDEVRAPEEFKRPLTDKIFDHYRLKPAQLCHVFVNRKMVSHGLFWEILHKHRVLLISKWAHEFRQLVLREYSQLRPKIVGAIDFHDFHQIPLVLKEAGKYNFDLALVSAGVNAVVLAPRLAKRTGKVVIDFGKVMMFFLTSDPRIAPWKPPVAPQNTQAQQVENREKPVLGDPFNPPGAPGVYRPDLQEQNNHVYLENPQETTEPPAPPAEIPAETQP